VILMLPLAIIYPLYCTLLISTFKGIVFWLSPSELRGGFTVCYSWSYCFCNGEKMYGNFEEK
jgi:hypothetical protein